MPRLVGGEHHSWEDMQFTENYIKQLHGILLKYSSKDIAHRGKYKKFPNNVEAFDASGRSIGTIFETASPFETPHLMKELVDWAGKALREGDTHPILAIAAFVVHFLAIHPFQDGNGRLSRVITTLLLLKYGYSYVPYCSMERIVEENKDSYYRALRSSQRHIRSQQENLDDWVRFFIQTLKKQNDTLLRKIEQEQILAQLPPLSERILLLAKERGRLTIAESVTLLSINRNTAKLRFRQLVHKGHLIQHGVGKSTWYSPGE